MIGNVCDVTMFISWRRVRWVGHVARMGDVRYAYNILVGKPERKSSFEDLRSRWEDNITLDFREIGWEVVDWMHPAQDRN
jgi:hypothetical protein